MNELAPIVKAGPGLTMAAEGMPRRAFTIAEVEAMVRAGIIPEKERFEMVGGELVPMSPKGARHEWVKHGLNRHLQRTLPDEFAVMVETTLRLDDNAFIEPDFVIVPKGAVFPGPIRASDVRLAIEVADTSLRYDSGRKIGVYAAYGIPEVWVVNAKTLATAVFRGLGNEPYEDRFEAGFDDELFARGAPVRLSLGGLGLTPATGGEEWSDPAS